MIEAGIATIAICLPTLQSLLSNSSVQSIVASVRSAISLESLRSRASGGSRGSMRTGTIKQTPYSELHTTASSIHGHAPSNVETVIEGEIERPPLPPDSIYIRNEFLQKNNAV